MSGHSAAMYCCIRDIDAETAVRLWKQERPHAPQPENTYQAVMMLHYARTKLASMPQRLRFYSHCWLRDEGLPSALPDHLKPKAERMYPVGVRAVGIASGSAPGRKGPFNYAIEKVMSDAVKETYADGHENQPEIVRARMLEKRAEFKRRA
jgi:hypothetical protein